MANDRGLLPKAWREDLPKELNRQLDRAGTAMPTSAEEPWELGRPGSRRRAGGWGYGSFF